jgi:geranylgeranyl diphosphate synthase type I
VVTTLVSEPEPHPDEHGRFLDHARATVDPALRGAIDTLPPGMRRVAGYHFGWWDADGADVLTSTGKAIRPALLFAAARAVGGVPDEAVDAAAAVEVVHNFSLLHDDVIDADLTRRHRQTAWSVFGQPDALMAGDALLALAFTLLGDTRAAHRRLAECVIELCEGQHLDCAFESRTDITLFECLAMAHAKTGALLGCCCALGGLYGGGAPDTVAALDGFGRRLGLAFQLVDDLLGIWGDPDRTGKPARADLAARKKSLPVVYALTSGTRASRLLEGWYRAAGPLPDRDSDLVDMADLVAEAGGREWARKRAETEIAAALDELTTALPDPATTRELRALAALVTQRQY